MKYFKKYPIFFLLTIALCAVFVGGAAYDVYQNMQKSAADKKLNKAMSDYRNALSEDPTQAAIDAAKKELENGTRFVFADFTYGGGKTLTADLLADVDTDDKCTPDTKVVEEKNGKLVFMESKFRAAPYFELRVDGITELQNAAN